MSFPHRAPTLFFCFFAFVVFCFAVSDIFWHARSDREEWKRRTAFVKQSKPIALFTSFSGKQNFSRGDKLFVDNTHLARSIRMK